MVPYHWVAFLFFLLGLTACRKSETNQTQATAEIPSEYMVRGVVRQLTLGGTSLVVKHEEVPGFMPAMTMPFDVRDTNELARIKPGDLIQFRMLITTNDGWIDRIQVLGTVTNTPADPSPIRFASSVPVLNAGDPLPDYVLTNELGKTIRLSDFSGKVLVFTFIFTRCPYPDFCPRMTDHFSRTLKKLASNPSASTKVHLLSISFDPERDTPELLLAYAERYAYDPKKWSLATGAWDQLEPLTGHFGLVFGRDVPPEKMEHNLRTVVVRPSGKIQAVINSNEWDVDDLIREIEAAAK
ncbi:MAG: redoxin domain-containing protein [Pedosphaera sp.]|nr:redoxin domain-containing protein [Pedosphaera sp.]